MNPYDLTDADNRARNEAYIARAEMYYLKCKEFLNSIQSLLLQIQIWSLACNYKDNKFLAGENWKDYAQKKRFDSLLTATEGMLHDIRIMALGCGELTKECTDKVDRQAFIHSFLNCQGKLEFYQKELEHEREQKAQIKFFTIEKRWQESTQ